MAVGIIILVVILQVVILVAGWAANQGGHQGWNLVGVFLFLLLPLMVGIPWVGATVYITHTMRAIATVCLAESAVFFVLATFNMVVYPEGFWVGLGAVGLLTLSSLIYGSPVSWLRRFVLVYGVATLLLLVYYGLTGGPRYTDSELELIRHDQSVAQADSAKWAAVLSALPKVPYESLSKGDRALYDEARRRIEENSTPSRIVGSARKAVIGAIGLVFPDPIEVSVKMTHYLDVQEVCDPRLRERESWRVSIPLTQYTRQVKGNMDVTDTGDRSGRYIPLVDGVSTGKTVQGVPCHDLTWNVTGADRPFVLNGTVKLNPVTLTVRFEPL